MIDSETQLDPPETPESEQDPKPLREQVKDAVDARDVETLVALLDPLPPSAALRQLLLLVAEDRDILLALVPVELAADLIVEAPVEAATDLVERMPTDRAAAVLDKLDSDLQADIIGKLEPEDAHAILTRLHPDDAADVRRLTEYEDDTAGGLMVADAFEFPETATVGAVLQGIASDDADFERYRGQHPYVVDAKGCPVGVVSLRELLTSNRNKRLSAIMAPPVTVTVGTSLDELEDLFDKHGRTTAAGL